jgi:hypothetical protein
MNKEFYTGSFEKLIFKISEIVLEYCQGGCKYCVRDGYLFKCSGGFKDYKKNQYVPTSWKILEYVNLQSKSELKELAYKLGVPVLHYRRIKKMRVGLNEGC